MDELGDFLEFVDIEEQRLVRLRNRIPKRYIRDAENPMEFYREKEFVKRYRYSKVAIRDVVFPIIDGPINLNNRGLPIPLILQLLITLRFYATGSFQAVHGDLRGISQASVSRIIKKISITFAHASRQYIKFPETEIGQRENIQKFYAMHGFPSVSGCVDGTHITITNPGTEAAEVFRNRKRYFSMNVQVVAGPNMEILDIVVRHPGSAHDNTIFERSAVCMRIQQHILGLFLGDNGYACRSYILTPLLNPVTQHESNYNRSHISTRNIVERLFGVWKRRFPCLSRTLSTTLQTSAAIISATAVLHNIAIQNNLGEIDEPIIPEDNINEDVAHNNVAGLAYRRAFIAAHF